MVDAIVVDFNVYPLSDQQKTILPTGCIAKGNLLLRCSYYYEIFYSL